MGQSNIIPFGKYAGMEFETVVARDPQYVQWLRQQAWFNEKFPHLTVNINNFAAEPVETPEHNALQVKFLDDQWAVALSRCLFSTPPGAASAVNELAYPKRVKTPVSEYRNSEVSYHRSWHDSHRSKIKELWKSRVAQRRLAHAVRSNDYRFRRKVTSVEFEKVMDVSYEIDMTLIVLKDGEVIDKTHMINSAIYVEIKPALGDDYPAVLRQMTRQIKGRHGCGRFVLLIGQYAGQGATLDQVRQIFAASHFDVLTIDEVEARLSPDFTESISPEVYGHSRGYYE